MIFQDMVSTVPASARAPEEKKKKNSLGIQKASFQKLSFNSSLSGIMESLSPKYHALRPKSLCKHFPENTISFLLASSDALIGHEPFANLCCSVITC